MQKIILIALSVFCFQHLIRDYLQDRGVKDWYTTFGHLSFLPDSRFANHVGMLVFIGLGCLFLYFAFHAA